MCAASFYLQNDCRVRKKIVFFQVELVPVSIYLYMYERARLLISSCPLTRSSLSSLLLALSILLFFFLLSQMKLFTKSLLFHWCAYICMHRTLSNIHDNYIYTLWIKFWAERTMSIVQALENSLPFIYILYNCIEGYLDVSPFAPPPALYRKARASERIAICSN